MDGDPHARQVDEVSKAASEFEGEARKLLTDDEWKEAKYVLLDRSAVTEDIDRVTSQKRAMWMRDPDTGLLVPDVTLGKRCAYLDLRTRDGIVTIRRFVI